MNKYVVKARNRKKKGEREREREREKRKGKKREKRGSNYTSIALREKVGITKQVSSLLIT